MPQKQHKKILYVIPGSQISGGIYIVLQHVNYLQSVDHDVYLYNMDGKTTIDWFDSSVKIYTSGDLAEVMTTKWDVAIATQFGTVKFVSENVSSKRKIYFVQSDERRFPLSQTEMALCIASYRYEGFEYMTEARWIERWLADEFQNKTFYVPNGLDQTLFYPLDDQERKNIEVQTPKKKKRVLIEGSINNPNKGMQDAYAAAKDLDVDIWIVSTDGAPPSDWRCTAFFEGVSISKMREIYGQCDVFLKMSRVEGFFGPPLESMACGTPAVVGKCTGYDEYIVDGENALVVEMGDIAGARMALEQVLTDDELRNSLIKEGLDTAKKWSWERSFDALDSVVNGEAVIDEIPIYEGQRYDYDAVLQEATRISKMHDDQSNIAIIAQRDAYIEDLSSQLENRRQDMYRLQDSKFWKLRDHYLKLKKFVSLKSENAERGVGMSARSEPLGENVVISDRNDRIIFDSGDFTKKRGTLTVIAHYSADPSVDPYFLHYVKSLAQFGDVVVVSTCTNLNAQSQEQILTFARRLIIKENVGYDFKSWITGIKGTAGYRDYDQVILTNDSIFGPLYDLREILEMMSDKKLDVWGMTDTYDRSYHLQSYFMVYGKKPIRDGFLESIFVDFDALKDKEDLIEKFEIDILKSFEDREYSYGSYISIDEAWEEIHKKRLTRFYTKHKSFNPTNYLWEYLIVYRKFPFLKKDVLTKNWLKKDTSLVRSVIENYTEYDSLLIDKYIKERKTHEGIDSHFDA